MIRLLCSKCLELTLFHVKEDCGSYYIIKCVKCGDEVAIGKQFVEAMKGRKS